jgi:uncharacterized membrane protein
MSASQGQSSEENKENSNKEPLGELQRSSQSDEITAEIVARQIRDNPDVLSSPSVVKAILMSKSHKGPLPPPEDMVAYDKAVPGLAERITRMAELGQQHSIKMDKDALEGNFAEARRGQGYAFVIAMTGILGGCILIGLGHDWPGASVIGGSLATIVIGFLSGRTKRDDE